MRRSGLGRALFGLAVVIAFLGGLLLFTRPMTSDLPLAATAATAFSLPAKDQAIRDPATAPAATIAPPPAAQDPRPPTARTEPDPDRAAESAAATVIAETRPGDTALKMLARMGVDPEDAQAATRMMSTVWDPRDMRPGQKVTLSVQNGHLHSFRVALGPAREIAAARDDAGNFVAEDQARPTNSVRTFGAGRIVNSLSQAAAEAGIPVSVIAEMIRAFSYDVDFQREVKSGDTFAMLYDRVHDETGKPTSIGNLIYAEMVLSGKALRLYRYTPPGGEAGFYNALGENTRKSLLRTPVDGASITSGFGMRWHPILGFSRMHQGVDFGVPTGTPVYAAGDGTVTKAAPAGGYGNYVEIEHNRQYATAYAHLSRFAVHQGEHVRQGEVIGYVGMTGLTTGPHLHYEVHYHNAAIDPLSVKMPAMTRLAGAELKAFEASRRAIDAQLQRTQPSLIARNR